MDRLPRVTLSGDLEGDYVVLTQRGGGVLRIAPAQTDGVPTVVALKQTTSTSPTQWEGALDDGRALYARSRRGEFSAGIGDEVGQAIDNSMSDKALCFEYVEDGPMRFAELHAHLHGLVDFPEGLVVKGERDWGEGLTSGDDG